MDKKKFITNDNIDKFVKLYKKAKKNKDETFIFEKSEVLTKYAQYLLEFLNIKTD